MAKSFGLLWLKNLIDPSNKFKHVQIDKNRTWNFNTWNIDTWRAKILRYNNSKYKDYRKQNIKYNDYRKQKSLKITSSLFKNMKFKKVN